MERTPDTREGHLTQVRAQATARLDGGDVRGALECLTAGMRSHTETHTALTMRILASDGERYARDGDAANMAKLIGLLCGPVPPGDHFRAAHGKDAV